MKRLPSTLALTLLLVAGPVLGQAIDLGPGVSGYTRFLVYPHLQKGFDALRDADRARAIVRDAHRRSRKGRRMTAPKGDHAILPVVRVAPKTADRRDPRPADIRQNGTRKPAPQDHRTMPFSHHTLLLSSERPFILETHMPHGTRRRGEYARITGWPVVQSRCGKRSEAFASDLAALHREETDPFGFHQKDRLILTELLAEDRLHLKQFGFNRRVTAQHGPAAET